MTLVTHDDTLSSWDDDTVSHWGDDTVSHTDVDQLHVSDVAFDGGIERTECDNWVSCSADEVNTAANLKKRTVIVKMLSTCTNITIISMINASGETINI